MEKEFQMVGTKDAQWSLFSSKSQTLRQTIWADKFWGNFGLFIGSHFGTLSTLKFVYSKKVAKFWEIFTLLFSTLHTDKSKVEISQNFVAFSESMNFNAYVTYHVGNSTIAVILLNSYVSRENFDGKNFMKKGWVRQKMHLCFLWWLNANST